MTARALDASLEAPVSATRRALIVLSVMTCATLVILDVSLVTVTLPRMQGSFSATQDQISWMVTSFIIGTTVAGACVGWFADKFGRKRLFLVSAAGFTLGYVLAGSATELAPAVEWRTLQGAFGAPLLPLSQAICLDAYPKRLHGRVNAVWGVFIMIGPILAPVFGGYLTEAYSWRWAMFAMVPLGALGFLGVLAFVPESLRQPERALDWLGFTTLIVAVGASQFVLNRGERLDWFDSTEVLLAAGLALLCLYLFVVQCFTARRPFVEVRMFGDWNASTGLLLGLLWGLMLNGIVVLLSLLMQNLRGYPAVTIGLLLAPRGAGMILGMILAERIMAVMDHRHVLVLASLSMAGTGWFMAQWTPEVGAAHVAWAAALQGFSAGVSWVPLATLTFSTIARRYRTEALVIFHLLIQMGSSTGIAAGVNILTRSSNASHATLTEHVTPFNELFHAPAVAQHWDLGSQRGLAAIEGEITRQSEMIGHLSNFQYLALLALAIIPLAYLFRRAPPERRGE
ncbi:MAG: DHA2 family efflux MFS transporter permease subunit [Alphaproteobacteria bacterium]